MVKKEKKQNTQYSLDVLAAVASFGLMQILLESSSQPIIVI
jgi:hypothetical protein|nr:MAG TPA: hypothetical protein [Bacteriophage sp.]